MSRSRVRVTPGAFLPFGKEKLNRDWEKRVMAYKPYKINTGKNAGVHRRVPQEKSSFKLFGLRSGLSYRMLPALAYYIIVTIVYLTSIINEVKYFSFTGSDIILEVSKYLFIGIMLYSPAIFLSDFKYVEHLPFFKDKSFKSSCIGLILVFCFCYFMWNVDLFCMSDTYKESVTAYRAEQQKELEKKIEAESTEQASVIETTVSKEKK